MKKLSKKTISSKAKKKVKLYKFNELSNKSRTFAIYDEIKAIIEMSDTEKEREYSMMRGEPDLLLMLVYFNHVKDKEERIFGSSLFEKDGTFVEEV